MAILSAFFLANMLWAIVAAVREFGPPPTKDELERAAYRAHSWPTHGERNQCREKR